MGGGGVEVVVPCKTVNESVAEIVFTTDTNQLETEYHFLLR
jgi:hypothetical protein